MVPPIATGPPSSTAGAAGVSSRPGPTRVGAAGAGSATGVLEQATSSAATAAASVPRMVPARRAAPWKVVDMWIILLEALVALALLLGIVWWTMFAGRSRGERRDED
jgi:hypothetical protein